MAEIKRIEHPHIPKIKRVGIYCRVSSSHAPQLASLAAQVSYLTKAVTANPLLRLCDIYIDVKSGEAASTRSELVRLIEDCRCHKLDIVITRNISRLSRDTVELLAIIHKLHDLGVEVIFDQEMLSTADGSSELLISVIEAIAQADNDSRSKNIKWGIVNKARNGTSGLYKRRCYGYFTDNNGNLQINENEASIVRSIFDLYLEGQSLIGIIRTLESDGIKTPIGRGKWSKRTLDHLLSNEKYSGDVVIFKTYSNKDYIPFKVIRQKENRGEFDRFIAVGNHPAIVSKEVFNAVQTEKKRRTNIDDNGSRLPHRYSTRRGGNAQD